MDDLIDDTPQPVAVLEPGQLRRLSDEDVSRAVRQAESGRNPRRDVMPSRPVTVGQVRHISATWRPPSMRSGIYRVPPRRYPKTDWVAVLLALVAALALGYAFLWIMAK